MTKVALRNVKPTAAMRLIADIRFVAVIASTLRTFLTLDFGEGKLAVLVVLRSLVATDCVKTIHVIFLCDAT